MSTSNIHHHVFVTTMPCEIGAAAIFKTLVYGDSNVVRMTALDAEKEEETLKQMEPRLSAAEEDKQVAHFYLIGTYWRKCLPTIARKYTKAQFHVWCMDKLPAEESIPSNVKYTQKGGPASFVLSVAKQVSHFTQEELKAFEKKHAESIALMDARVLGLQQELTNHFYTGLCNLVNTPDELERFSTLFAPKSNLKVQDILNRGKDVTEILRVMARDRAIKNARHILLKDGKTEAVATNAPELVNITHEELHKAFPKVDVTVTMAIRMDTPQPRITYSFRSYSDKVDVGRIATVHYQGGGSSYLAGGWLSCTSITAGEWSVPLLF